MKHRLQTTVQTDKMCTQAQWLPLYWMHWPEDETFREQGHNEDGRNDHTNQKIIYGRAYLLTTICPRALVSAVSGKVWKVSKSPIKVLKSYLLYAHRETHLCATLGPSNRQNVKLQYCN